MDIAPVDKDAAIAAILQDAQVKRHWRVVVEKFPGPLIWGTFSTNEAEARRHLERLRKEGSNVRLQCKLLAEYDGWKIESPWGDDE